MNPIAHGPWRVVNGALVLDIPEPVQAPMPPAPTEHPEPAVPETTPATRSRRTRTTED
jgi:hypothetical protein